MKNYTEFILKESTADTSVQPSKKVNFDESAYNSIMNKLKTFWKNDVLTKKDLNFDSNTKEELDAKRKDPKYKDHLTDIDNKIKSLSTGTTPVENVDANQSEPNTKKVVKNVKPTTKPTSTKPTSTMPTNTKSTNVKPTNTKPTNVKPTNTPKVKANVKKLVPVGQN